MSTNQLISSGILTIARPLSHVPYTDDKGDITACGIPENYNASKEWADKKVVLFAVPGRSFPQFRQLQAKNQADGRSGAFTPGCSVKHLPPYIENLKAIKDKGVDTVAVVAFNDAWVMSAWGKANGVKGDDIVGLPTRLSLSNSKMALSRSFGP